MNLSVLLVVVASGFFWTLECLFIIVSLAITSFIYLTLFLVVPPSPSTQVGGWLVLLVCQPHPHL
jgi:hypothetical protein